MAAIVHDAELDASPELVSAAASAAALAIDNERLKAELRARVEELRVSRLRIVEAADDARRRIERDLHDGAQQQLVSLALDLRMLKARLGDSGLSSTVDEIGEKLAVALAELREFARGIHPAFLSERGVGAAVEALVARAPIEVDAVVELDERLPAPVEAATYFVIAEGLTNVVRYAETREALRACLAARRRGGVVVSDDGIGGATVDGGTGLRGLIDRLAVLDGRLDVVSPPGEGHAAGGAHPDPARLARGRGGVHVRRAAAPAARCSLLAGCGSEATEVREPDVVVQRRATPSPRATRPAHRAACGSPTRGSCSSRTARPRTRSGRSSSAGSATRGARPAPPSPTARRTASRSSACALHRRGDRRPPDGHGRLAAGRAGARAVDPRRGAGAASRS